MEEEYSFKTYDDQIEILKSKNLIIDDEKYAIKKLKEYGYYNIISGYKEPFLEINNENEEKYYSTTKFEHIVSLYEFDKEIKNIFFKHLLYFESVIKNKISYYHSQISNKKYNYLDPNMFSGKIEDITNLISVVLETINKDLKKNKIKDELNVYIEKKQEIPLWVLFKKLSFGCVGYFYSVLKLEIKEEILKELNQEYIENYSLKKLNIELLDSINLERIIKFFVYCRNLCGHSESFYSLRYNKKIILKNSNYRFKGTIFDLMLLLKIFLPKDEYTDMVYELKKEVEKLEKNFIDNSSALSKIIAGKMTLPKNWEKILQNFGK